MDIFLLILAVVPAVGLLILIYFGDKLEKEPVGLVFGLLGMGALSTIPSVVAEVIGVKLLDFVFPTGGIFYNFFMYFFVVAVSEELFKFLFMFVITWKNKNFDYVFDGVIYAVSSSLGFALIENIGYVFTQRWQFGFLAGVGTGIFQNKLGKCSLYIVLSLIVPMLIHGVYDFCCTASNMLMMIVFFIFVAGMYGITITMCIYFSRHDHNITGRLKIKVTKDGWLRYAITDQREVMILGLTKPLQNPLLVIPEKIEGFPVCIIARSAFAYTNVVNVQLPKNLRLIEDNAFFHCTSLQNVGLPNQLVGIGSFAFEYCSSLSRFLIPHVRFIGSHVFEGCNQLTDIYYLGSQEEWKQIRINIYENSKLLSVRFYYNAIRR